MNDMLLIAAGVGGALIACFHGYLGYRLVLPQMQVDPGPIRRVNTAVFQLSTLYWFAGGLTLIAAPVIFTDSQRILAVAGVVFLYAAGAIGNFWATRGRHPGWALLTIVAIMAVAGVQ